MSGFKKATKEQSKLRLVLHGPSGAGKTYSALSIATNLGARVALVDSESGSASKYADKFDFDVMNIKDDYHPDRFIAAIKDAAEGGYDVVVLDSLTHAWNGVGGFLELVDKEAKRAAANKQGGRPDSHAAWKAVDPIYRRFINAILTAPIHVVATLRAKQEYERNNGKVEKLGMAPQMRDSFEYEFDIEGMLNMQHELVIGKTRFEGIDGGIYPKPGKDFAAQLRAWLESGAVPVKREADPEPAVAADNTEVTKLLWSVFQSARNPADLDDAVKQTRKAKSEGHISDATNKELASFYKQRKAEIAATIAKASEPAADDHAAAQ